MYSPDYTCVNMLNAIIKKIKEEVVTEANMKYLSEAMDKVSRMEAYEDYGISELNTYLTYLYF